MPQSGVGTVAYGAEDEGKGFQVTFYEEPLLLEALSADAGHPIFRTQVMTRLEAYGNRLTTWVHATFGLKYETGIDPESGEVVTTYDVQEVCDNGDTPEPMKYPKAWARFMKKAAISLDGFPIEEWGAITKSYAQSLKAYNIFTVEALAGLTDTNAQNIMGGIKYRDLARAALDERQRTSIVSREQENARKAQERAEGLERQVAQLTDTVNKLMARLEGQQTGRIHGFPEDAERRQAENAAPTQLKALSAATARKKQARTSSKAQQLVAPEA